MDTTMRFLLPLLMGLGIGALIGLLWARSREQGQAAAASQRALESRAADQAVVKEGLARLQTRLHDLDTQRTAWQSAFKQQVDDVRHSTDLLRRETLSLSTALRRPQVRGRWGEMHLRRAVELAGMVERCDFSEQHTVSSDGGRLRPDLVVHLAGGKQVVVDAKVPLDAFLDATSADDEPIREAHLARHARQLRQHVDTLAAKAYWRSLPATPEFVVMFVPGESFLSAALGAEPALIEYAAERQVVLATPTTLIALLRTVAHAWTEARLADAARDIHALGRDLHTRLATMGGHLEKLGRSLTSAVGAYNSAVGSLETRVLVSARRFSDLDPSVEVLTAPQPVSEAVRPLGAAELLESVADRRPELPHLEAAEPVDDHRDTA
ncbi:MAG TPA: DNA recombination protein RmuC [Nocardioidaceae bacterium]|nr:DNA recombination protein RmuC [Nocardioidaceae bacterium]